MTLGAGVELALSPYRTRWHLFVDNAGRKEMRRIQWVYIALSFAALWWLLGYTERRAGEKWMAHIAFSVFYLAVFAVLGAALVPPSTWRSIARGTSRLVKVGLLANYLSALLLLNIALASWWTRATMLATLFGATWLGLWFACRFLWPAYQNARALFLGTQERPFDASAPQGRNAQIE